MPFRIACIGGGPGGLLFTTLIKQQLPCAEVVLYEQNGPSEAFGFGVVFSDPTLRHITEADPVLRDALHSNGRHWDTIEIWLKGDRHQFSGNGMSAIHRKTLLSALQRNAMEAGVDMRFETFINSPDQLEGFDLIVAADGANSLFRRSVGEQYLGHEAVYASAKFIWFGTTYMFDGLTFVHRRNEHGNFAAHAYPISNTLSTFIVETDEQTWQRAGLNEFDVSQLPGVSDIKSKEYIESLFVHELQGESIVVNNSRWGNFRTHSTRRWHSENIVFLGDAIHTAHFSVGSGTKMAMEDAIALSEALSQYPRNLSHAFTLYEGARSPKIAKIHNAARPSLSWWEHFGKYHNSLDPLQFSVHFSSRAITLEKIRRRDPSLVAAAETEWKEQHGTSPLDTALEVLGLRFGGRFLAIGPEGLSDGTCALPLDAAGLTVVKAPETEADVETVSQQLPQTGAALVHGGSYLARRLLSEEARLVYGLTTIVVEDTDDDGAETMVLSGRADAVAVGSLV